MGNKELGSVSRNTGLPMSLSLPPLDSLSMEFSRQEYWTGFPFPPPGDLLNPGVEPVSPTLATRFFTTDPPGKPICMCICI